MTENQIFNDLFLQYADSDAGYEDPLTYEIIGKHIMALGLETLVFQLLNLFIEVLLDESPPFGPKSPFNMLTLSNVTKKYKSFNSAFKAVDNIR